MRHLKKKNQNHACLLAPPFPQLKYLGPLFFFFVPLSLRKVSKKRIRSRNEIKYKAFKAPEVILGSLEL